MAYVLLSVTITAVTSELTFYIGGKILVWNQSCLLWKNVESLICTQSWLYIFEDNM